MLLHSVTQSCPILRPHELEPIQGIPRQEHWGGLPGPPPGDLPSPGVQPLLLQLLTCQVGSLTAEPPESHTPFTEKNKKPKITLVQNDTATMGWQCRDRAILETLSQSGVPDPGCSLDLAGELRKVPMPGSPAPDILVE